MLLLHAGLRKAGSTSIQAFLSANVNPLRQIGYDYPVAGRGPRANHLNLVHDLNRHHRFVPGDGGMRELVEYGRGSGVASMVLSSEMFEGLGQKEISRLRRQLLKIDPDIRVIFILRDLIDLIPSSYAQKMKFGFKKFGFDQFFKLRMEQDRVDYSTTVGNWINEFGRENVVCRTLDPRHLVNGDLIDELVTQLGVDPASPEIAAMERPAVQNQAPGWRVLELVRALHTGRHGLPADHPLPAIARTSLPRIMPLRRAKVIGLAAQMSGDERGWNLDRGRYLTLTQAKTCMQVNRRAIAELNADHGYGLPLPRTLEERGFEARGAYPDIAMIPADDVRAFYDDVSTRYDGVLAEQEAAFAAGRPDAGDDD